MTDARADRAVTRRGAGVVPRRHHPLAIGLTALALLVLGTIASRPALSATEEAVFFAFNDLPGWTAYLVVPVMQVGTLFAGPVVGAVALLAKRRQLAIELLFAGIGGWLTARVLKVLVSRPRPAFLIDEVVIRGGEATGLGYPSGHVTVATALATVLAAWLPWRWEVPLWIIVALVGVGRMFVGAHLPLDVVGGLLLGGLIGAAVRTVFHVTRLRHTFEDTRDT